MPQEPQTGNDLNAASTETDSKDYTPSSHNSPANYIEDNTSYGFQQEKVSSHSDEDYEEDEVEEEDDDDYEYVGSNTHQQLASVTHAKKRTLVNSSTSNSRKQPTTQQYTAPQNNASTEQVECCLLNCHNPCSNRLRFSLKSLELTHFKSDYLEKDWNRICNYCYFHTLYTFKKQMASHQQNSSGDEATTTTTRKRRNSGAKRPRERKEATSSMFTALPSISAEYKPSSEEEEATFTKKVRNV